MISAIGPEKDHCTWYKVLMINRFLNEEKEQLVKENVQVEFAYIIFAVKYLRTS